MLGPTHENGQRVRYVPLGHEQLTVGSAAVGLASVPADVSRVRRIVVRNLGQPICWTDDGSTPTGSHGFYQYSNEIFVTDAGFDQLQFIQAADATGAADLRVIYYG